MFDTILVAIDGSDSSKNALRTACEAFGAQGARILVLHAPQAETTAFAVGAVAGYHEVLTTPTHDELVVAGEEIAAEAAALAKEAGCEVETMVRIGDPVRHVLQVAKERDVDLIVTGRRGLGGVAGLFLGSTSQRIQHHATCACLTVI